VPARFSDVLERVYVQVGVGAVGDVVVVRSEQAAAPSVAITETRHSSLRTVPPESSVADCCAVLKLGRRRHGVSGPQKAQKAQTFEFQ
jgi:hypothetical protein